MAGEKTQFLGLTYFPSIVGVYQREIREALVSGTAENPSNMEVIDAAFGDALEAFGNFEGALQGVMNILNGLAEVATSGSYNDLSDKPDIPNAVPIATTAILGKVKPDGVTILIDANGTIRATCEIATPEKAGIVKPDGKTTQVDAGGAIRVLFPTATAESLGLVKPDNVTIGVDETGTLKLLDKYYQKSEVYTKSEVEAMLQQLSDMLLPAEDIEEIYTATNTLMGEETEFTGFGASLLQLNALADALLGQEV